MLLVQNGQIALDDRISKYYPSAPAAWDEITIRHLLTHSSGISDRPFGGSFEDTAERLQSYKDAIPLMTGDPLLFEPGTAFHYSNIGYALLTAVVESVSLQSYVGYLHGQMFAPLGVQQTSYARPEDNVRGYERAVQGTWLPATAFKTETFGGFGGLTSTVDDVFVWSRALRQEIFFSPSVRESIFTDYGYNYGFGWRFARKHGRRLIWHSGNIPGFASVLDQFPEEELIVIVLTNNTGLTGTLTTLTVGRQEVRFVANAARKLIDEVEKLYFEGPPP
jgi:CubicO group peptidase (beta-lactamase class C family)